MRHVIASLTVLASFAAGTSVAGAAIAPTRDALTLARALADRPEEITGAAFVSLPPVGNPAAVSDTPLGEYPTSGPTYTILSTGDATIADQPNTRTDSGSDNEGPPDRGARDVVTLRVDFLAPPSVSCVSLRFRFYSEEFPEFVGSRFNDAFIAELDRTTWTSSLDDPRIVAPDNFAVDTLGNPISINGIGDASVSASRASGTTYDGATRRLRASAPITPGPHSLYLTIFDQGDRLFDSAVFLDRLTLSNLRPCAPGAAADLSSGTPPGAIRLPGGAVSIPAANVFEPERLVIDRASYRPRPVRRGGAFTLRARVRDSRGYVVRGAWVSVRGFPTGTVARTPDRATARDGTVTFRLRATAATNRLAGRNVALVVRARKRRFEDDEPNLRAVRVVSVRLRGTGTAGGAGAALTGRPH